MTWHKLPKKKAGNNLFWSFITILHTINLTAYHYNSILQNRWTQRRKKVLSSLSNSLFVSVIDYNAEGCYKDSKKKSKKIFTKKFSTVEGVNRRNPDVEKIFLKCKDLAEKEGYEIFAIQVIVLILY